MNNIIQQDGEFGISSVIKAARPTLHTGGILRSAGTAMKNFDGPVNQQLTLKFVKGRKTQMASLSTCEYILDNLPGQSWVEWRTTHGDSFKESLAQLVAPKESQVQVQEVEEDEEVQETKASILKKALRTLDINAGARIDEASGEASIVDVIRIQSPESSPQYAAQMLSRFLEKEDEDMLGSSVQNCTQPESIRDRIHHIKINGKGRITPVCDAKTLIEIMWGIPSLGCKSFKRECAQVICKVMGGDVSLCAEIEERRARLQSTPQGQAYQNFVLGGNNNGGATPEEPQAKRTRIGPEIMELASEEEYAKYVQVGLKQEMVKVQQEMVKSEVSLVMSLKDAFEQIRPLEPRQKIELSDIIGDIQRRAFRSTEEKISPVLPAIMNTETSQVNAVARASSQQQDPGHDIPTPQCSRGVRGEEISISMIASEMGVSVRGRGGLVGKKLKALYAERYGQNAANNIPKRPVIYAGRPYHELSYWRRDKDLVECAVRAVVG